MKKEIVSHMCAALGYTMAAALMISGVQSIPALGRKTAVVEPMAVYADNYNVVNTKSEITNKQESDKIAVVNLDEGVISNGTKRIYANEIIRIPEGANYEFTSLAAAQTGLENAQYGAYIVVPEAFSKTVVSVNGTPERCTVRYAINRNASAGMQYKLIQEVLKFTDDLNDDLSYIYLENILSEFHEAQDTAGTVMSNDLKDKEAIDRVKPGDLVALVQIPALETVENNTKALDVGTYAEQDATLVTEIGNEYSTSITNAQDQLSGLRDDGTNLSGTLAENSQSAVGSLDALQSINMTESMDSARNSIAEAESSDWESTENVIGEVAESAKTVDELIDNISEAIRDSNTEVQEDTRQGIKDAIDEAIMKIPDFPEIALTPNESNDEYTITIVSEELDEENSPAVILQIVRIDNGQDIEANRELLQTISSELMYAYFNPEIENLTLDDTKSWTVEAYDLYEIGWVEEPDPDNPEASIVREVPVECQDVRSHITRIEANADRSVIQVFDAVDNAYGDLIARTSYNSCSEFMEAVSRGEVLFDVEESIQVISSEEEIKAFNDTLKELHRKSITDTVDKDAIVQSINIDVDAYIYEGEADEKQIALDEDGQPKTLYENTKQSLKTSLDNAQNSLHDGLLVRSANLYSTETGVLNGTVNSVEAAISELNTNVANTRSIVNETLSNSVDAISDYGTKIGTFSPVLDSAAVSENVSKMNSNYSDLQQEVFANNQSYQEYADKVYEATDNNISTLRQNIADAQTVSENTVSAGLSDAKNVKRETSAQNQELLAEFSEKLPYTRLGTLENTNTYEFIASPIATEDISPKVKTKATSENASVTTTVKPSTAEKYTGRSASTGNTASANAATVVTADSESDEKAYIMPVIVVFAAGIALAAFFGIRYYMKKKEDYY